MLSLLNKKTVSLSFALLLVICLALCVGCSGAGQGPFATPVPENTEETHSASPADTEEPAPTQTEPLYACIAFYGAEGLDTNAFAADIAALAELMGSDVPELTVRVSDCDLPYYEDGTLYTSNEDFGSLGALSAAGRIFSDDLPEWAYRGAAQLAKNGREQSYMKLGAVLDTDAEIDSLAMLPTRFAPAFNTADDLKLNYRAAAGLVQFIIDKRGSLDLACLEEDKQEYVRALGLENDYSGLYEGLLDGCEVSFNELVDDYYAESELFPVVIRGESYTLYAQPLIDCNSAADLEWLLYKLEVGKQLMREFITEHADEYISVCQFGNKINYYMLNTFGFSYAQGENVVLRLEAKAILHETVHHWIVPHYYDHWYYEGLADFLALQGGEGESLEFVNSMARLAFMHPDTYSGGGVADYNKTPASERVPGDEFTYEQSCSLIAYICETYTLDPILAVSDGTNFTWDFVRAFGKSFEDVVEEWKEWLG